MTIDAFDPKFFDKLSKLLTIIEKTSERKISFDEAEKKLHLSVIEE